MEATYFIISKMLFSKRIDAIKEGLLLYINEILHFSGIDIPIGFEEGENWNPWRTWSKVEIFEGKNQYKCDKCRRNEDALRYTQMSNLPEVLVVHYNFFQCKQTTRFWKIWKRMPFRNFMF